MPLLEIHKEPLRGIWQITEEPDQMLSLLERKELYLPYLDTLTNKTRKQEWLAVRLLLKELLAEEPRISYLPTGAPCLPGLDYNISISHTKGYVAVLLAQKVYAVGIDIEFRSDRAFRLKDRILSPYELNGLDPADPETHALLFWSAKEALFKMIGQEVVDFRKHLCVEPFPLRERGSIIVRENRTEKGATYTLKYEVTPSYVLVWNV